MSALPEGIDCNNILSDQKRIRRPVERYVDSDLEYVSDEEFAVYFDLIDNAEACKCDSDCGSECDHVNFDECHGSVSNGESVEDVEDDDAGSLVDFVVRGGGGDDGDDDDDDGEYDPLDDEVAVDGIGYESDDDTDDDNRDENDAIKQRLL